jgi:DHA1 family tetracycline resistance protein-like MFS transporter
MSRRIGPHQQGRLQGANAGLMGVANLIGPGLFNLTFAFGAVKDWSRRARLISSPRCCPR